MSHIRVIICRVDEPAQMTELATFDLEARERVRLEAAHTLDDLEAQTHRVGHAILCRLLEAQWDLIDAQLTEQYVQSMLPTKVQRDSREPLKVASRFGWCSSRGKSVRSPIPSGIPSQATQSCQPTRGC